MRYFYGILLGSKALVSISDIHIVKENVKLTIISLDGRPMLSVGTEPVSLFGWQPVMLCKPHQHCFVGSAYIGQGCAFCLSTDQTSLKFEHEIGYNDLFEG